LLRVDNDGLDLSSPSSPANFQNQNQFPFVNVASGECNNAYKIDKTIFFFFIRLDETNHKTQNLVGLADCG
jgi:hypothetical protein